VDDRRIGLIVRALRRRRRWRQVDLARASGVSQSTISRFERGHLDELALRIVRNILAALDARGELELRWRGGQAERLVDERHAALGARVIEILRALGWEVLPEVTFQRYGERGSIDLLAWREAERAICVIELKSVVHSYEESQRHLDVKGRLAAHIAQERLGWRPRVVGVVMVVEGTTANRDRLAAIEAIVRAGLPATSRRVREWLRAPRQPLRGLWFVRPTHPGTGTRDRVGPRRVRRPGTQPSLSASSVDPAADLPVSLRRSLSKPGGRP
jgi:transcriptional regulator with XRE-family HTH domain